MAALTLYRIPQVVFLTLSGTGAQLMNFPVNRTDFKLFKNVTNDIDLFIKDQDRKAVNLFGKSIIINIVNDQTQTLLLQRELFVIDEYRGYARLTTTPTDTAEWESGFFSFTVTFMREDGTQVLLYTDQNYGPKSFIEVVDGPVPPPLDSTVIPASAFAIVSMGTPLLAYNLSGPYASMNINGDMHTAAVYTTKYSGRLWIQGSLENQVPTLDAEWFDIPIGATTDYFQFLVSSGIQSFNFFGNYMWIRFKTLTDGIFGTSTNIDQILYRN